MSVPSSPQSEPPDPVDDEEDVSTRHDVVIRKFEQRFYNFKTISMKLNTFIKPATQHNKFHQFINNVVDNQNLIAFHAWHLLNLHYLRLLENKLPLPKKITQTMIQRVCYYVSTTTKKRKLTVPKTSADPDGQWSLTQKIYLASLPKGYKFPSRDKQSNLINNLAKMMMINRKSVV